MSEFMNSRDNRASIRWKLLSGVSALALAVYVSPAATAEDAGQPQIWIELGGQLSSLGDGQESFSPAFAHSPPRPPVFTPFAKFDGPPRFGLDEDGKISFTPENSDWEFSASIHYGRSARDRHVRQQTNPKVFVTYLSGGFGQQRYAKYPVAAKFSDTNAQNSEHHLILDFQAGKDVGLGMFDRKDGSSTLSLGVRFAQFGSKSNIALKSDPDWKFQYRYFSFLQKSLAVGSNYHSNAASIRADRSFHGVGPSISWNGSAPLAGSSGNAEIAFDWGLNAALLFGRQRAKVHHESTVQYHNYKYYGSHLRKTIGTPVNTNHTRSRSVTVPNVGGFAGLSFRYADAKLSFGYRGDFFFSAIDGGIDARKNYDRSFYGPFASISVGLGD
jgi:iron complex outermembrane recepter protein